jgi:hypothetical protein
MSLHRLGAAVEAGVIVEEEVAEVIGVPYYGPVCGAHREEATITIYAYFHLLDSVAVSSCS